MRKLNLKNKIFIFIFSIIVLGIVLILIQAVKLSSNKQSGLSSVFSVTSNSAIYGENTDILNTNLGGEIKKSWNNNYYFTSTNDEIVELGLRSVVYEKAIEKVYVFGDCYSILESGDVIKNKDSLEIDNTNASSFYKLKDRQYLIISNEIYTEDKTIYTNKYLIVTLDKQGNASLLNDVINIKTINPLKLTFDKFVFDIANMA